MQVLKSNIKLKQKDGKSLTVEQNIEDNDILLFLDLVSGNSNLTMFMEEVLGNSKMLGLFSNHRNFFYSKHFEHRAVIIQKDEINDRALKMLKRFYDSKLSTEIPPYIEQIKNVLDISVAAAIKFIVTTTSIDLLKKFKKMSLRQISKIVSKKILDMELKESEKKELERELNKIYIENMDFYSFAFLFPRISIELSMESEPSGVENDVIEDLKKMGIIFPLFSIYICDNVKKHDYSSSPPFISVFLPHMEILEELVCPKCGSELKIIRYWGFIPEISRRIMGEGGFLPYILAYLLNKEGFSFGCNITTKNVNETDFIITKGGKQVYIEVKCFSREVNIKTRSGKEKVATKILNGLKQMRKNITDRWEKEKKIEFDRKILLTNFSKSEIESARKEINELNSKLQGKNLKVFGFDQLREMIEFLHRFLD